MYSFENITQRRRRRSESAIETSNECSSNNSTIEGATNNSVPNIIDDENEEMEQLKCQISELNSQLQTAHEEINNLSIENTELKKTIEYMNIKHKIVEKATKKLASEIGTPNKRIKLITPHKKTLSKVHQYNSRCGTPDFFTPTQDTLQDKSVQSARQKINNTFQGEKSKLCIISSNTTNKILPIAENTFPHHQICHYLLQRCGIKKLLGSIHTKLIDYTMKDYCIIFIGEDDFLQTSNYFDIIMNINETLSAIKHTNIILCLPIYKYNYYSTMYNFRIEMFNKLLYQDIQSYNYATLFDTNLNLLFDFTMFQRYSGRINNYAVTNIFKDLKNYIPTYCNVNSHKLFSNDKNKTTPMTDLLYCDSPNSYCSCVDDLNQNFFRL